MLALQGPPNTVLYLVAGYVIIGGIGLIYIASLVVNDGLLDSTPDTVTITTGNAPPVASAGPDQSVNTLDLVLLDGTGSSDANSDPLAYFWSLLSTPEGSSASLDNPGLVQP